MLKHTPFLLASLLVASSSPALAQINASQMQAAKASIAAGKIPTLNLNCPSVAIPSKVIRTQADLDKLNVQLKAKEACVQEIRDITYKPNLRSLAQVTYPKASEAQIQELTEDLMRATEPTRERVLEDLRSTQTNAIHVARPFVLRTQIEQAFLKEAGQCKKPATIEWTSVSATKAWMKSFEPFDECISNVGRTLEQVDGRKFVEHFFKSEPELVRSQVISDFKSIQRDLGNRIHDVYRDSLEPRIRAQRYIDTDGRTDKPDFGSGLVEDQEEDDEDTK